MATKQIELVVYVDDVEYDRRRAEDGTDATDNFAWELRSHAQKFYPDSRIRVEREEEKEGDPIGAARAAEDRAYAARSEAIDRGVSEEELRRLTDAVYAASQELEAAEAHLYPDHPARDGRYAV